MGSILILIQCQDKMGLVSQISRVIVTHNLNIDAMHEFVDEGELLFFARFECSGTATESAIRLISEFKQDKLIEVEGRNIKILNHEKLIRLGHVVI